MKVLFIFPDIDEAAPAYKGEVSLSIAYLAGALKEAGHGSDLLHVTREISKAALVEKIRRSSPGLIGFSSISQLFPYVRKYAKWIKEEFDIPVIAGGAHASLNSEDAIATEGVDFICVGEGELSLVEFCDAMARGAPLDAIPSIWAKRPDGTVTRNPVRPLVDDLDRLPMPDRTIFNMAKLEFANKRYPYASIRASRGCPYSCTYCSNHKFRDLYPNKHKMVRFHSVDRVIAEAKAILREVPHLRSFYFHDDVLPVHKAWFREFAAKYRKEIGLPYRCKGRVELFDEETAVLLKESGCFRIQFGIESGNPEILKLLRRPVDPAKITSAFAVCKKHGIQTHSFNMVGIPHEDTRKILDTIKVNAKVKPEVIIVSIYYPLPNTDLYDICKNEGLLTGREFVSMLSESALALPGISPVKVQFLHRYFRSLTEIYHAIYKLPARGACAAEKALDAVLVNMPLPYSFLISVHDRYFRNWLLDRSYFSVEDRIFNTKREALERAALIKQGAAS